jgi:hypothetical protein
MDIEMSFGREGRGGTRTIRISSAVESRRSTVSTVTIGSAVNTV